MQSKIQAVSAVEAATAARRQLAALASGQRGTATVTPRRRRGAAAVVAQYIQDLKRPAQPAPCA